MENLKVTNYVLVCVSGDRRICPPNSRPTVAYADP